MKKMKGIKELSEESGLTYNAIRQLCLENRIVHIKIGSKYMINVEKFEEFLNGGEDRGVEATIND